jgi:ParB-like chromosome segregation protein Spo0J
MERRKSKMTEEIHYLPIGSIKPDPNQPRTEWASHTEHISKLVESYSTHGIIEPIAIDENNTIVLGECRWRAANQAGLKTVPVRRIVITTQQERLEKQLIDDSQRKELSDQERVWAFATAVASINDADLDYTVPEIKELWKEDPRKLITLLTKLNGQGKTSGGAELARRIGVPQPTISYVLKYFDERISPTARKSFDEGKLRPTEIREATRIKDDSVREALLQSVADERPTGTETLKTSASERVESVRKLEKAQITDSDVLESAAKGKLTSTVVDDITSVKSPVAKQRLAKLATTIDDDVMRPAKIKEHAGMIAQAEIQAERMDDFKASPEVIEANIDWDKADAYLKSHPDNIYLQAILDCQSFLYFLDVSKAFCPICSNPASTHLRFTCHPDKTLLELAEIAEQKHDESKETWKETRAKIIEEREWEK